MTVTPITMRTTEDRGAPIHAGQSVNIRLTLGAQSYQMTNEAYSPAFLRTVSRQVTLWVRGTAPTDRFRLEMCYYPVFNVSEVFDPGASLWAQVGQQIVLSAGQLVAAQTLDDVAYAIRVVRVSAPGVPTPGNFEVYSWSLRG